MTRSMISNLKNTWFDRLWDCTCGCPPLENFNREQSTQKQRILCIALGLLSVFFCAEVGVSVWSGSLSLLADAGHMLSDVTALGLTLVANFLAQRPAAGRATFGHHRVEVLAALSNGLGLLAIAGFIAWEACDRFAHPEPVLALPMLMGAIAGLLVNSCNISLLHEHSAHDLNLRGALLHMVADVASSMGVLIAAIAIYLWQWQWVDPTASLLVAVLTGCSALPLIRESVEILLEYSPRSIDPDQVKSAILEFDQVKQVDDLHIWTVGSGQTLLCARLVTTELDGLARDQLTPQIQAHLRLHFGISQSILQIMSCQMLQPILLHPLFQQDLVTLIHQQAKTSTK